MATATTSSSRAASTVNSSGTPKGKGRVKNVLKSEQAPDEDKLSKLDGLLRKSIAYSSILAERLQEAQIEALKLGRAAVSKEKDKNPKAKNVVERDDGAKGNKRRHRESLNSDPLEPDSKRVKLAETTLQQPPLVTATLREYQLIGVQWMLTLHDNDLNGILADEMGLGKTLQTISFIAHLKSRRMPKPFLIVAPLSVLHNWATEFEKFAPSIPVCIYHGTPSERVQLQKEVLIDRSAPQTPPAPKKRGGQPPKTKASRAEESSTPAKKKAKPKKTSSKKKKQTPRTTDDEGDSEIQDGQPEDDNDEARVEDSLKLSPHTDDEDDEKIKLTSGNASVTEEKKTPKDGDPSSDEANTAEEPPKKPPMSTFPVVLTTYEMVIRDRAYLSTHSWGYIIVDEGHRLKNMDSKLMREIKQYDSANRMILTGTPLHNNLAELWSLLNFILPDIFSDLDSFQQWFNFPSGESGEEGNTPVLSEAHTQRIISSLHGILKPFLLRRLKADVETNIPPKKEYILYAPLTRGQVDIYEAILAGRAREWLIESLESDGLGINSFGAKQKPARKAPSSAGSGSSSESEEDEDGQRKMRLRRRGNVSYKVEKDDNAYFNALETGEAGRRKGEGGRGRKRREKTDIEIGADYARKQAIKSVNNMKLQNTIMQLRKVCSHPFLFQWPRDRTTGELAIGEQLVNASGKMLLLDRLLEALIGDNARRDPAHPDRPHKVLLFSQFVTMLDVIEDWAHEHKGWSTCRIDGSSSPQERREQMELFNHGGNGPNAVKLFLLSTRAGGLGINLVEADTVIFYDQDWNPQMDLQAQDRAHRIGQQRPVLIFRLVANHTVETKIMAKAGEKRKLEALVIAKGKFKVPHGKQTKQESVADLAASLLRLEGEKIHIVSSADDKDKVISDDTLHALLDRSPAIFEERGKGWRKDDDAKDGTTEDIPSRTAFEVFEAPQDETSDGLAHMMGDDE